MDEKEETADERLAALEERVAHLEARLDEETRKLASPYVTSDEQIVGLIRQ